MTEKEFYDSIRLTIGQINNQLATLNTASKSLYDKHENILKEVSESRTRILSDIAEIKAQVNQYTSAAIDAQRAANDTKNIVANSLKMCREDEAGRVVAIIEERLPDALPSIFKKAGIKPVFSIKQLLAQTGINFAGAIGVLFIFFFMISDAKNQVIRVEQKVDAHISTSVTK